jgi:hypothetical protein
MNSSHRSEGMLNIGKFIIQSDVLSNTIEFLREMGSFGYEGFALWSGSFETDNAFRFKTALIPEQKPMITDEGHLVIVEGEALFKVNKTVHQLGQILGGQVHTHPTTAYHSATDDHYPLVTLLGALSVVIPDFGKNAPADLGHWAFYRLVGYGKWESAAGNTEVVFE